MSLRFTHVLPFYRSCTLEAYGKTKRKEQEKELAAESYIQCWGMPCLKIQKDFSDPFDINEGLKQGDELSTLQCGVIGCYEACMHPNVENACDEYRSDPGFFR